jgi:hypothetical protein
VKLPRATLDAAVRREVAKVLRPAAGEAIIDGVLAAFAPASLAEDQARRQREFATLEREIANLAEAIATGGQLAPLLAALNTRQARRDVLAAEVAAEPTVDLARLDRGAVGVRVQQEIAAWLASLDGAITDTRQALRKILQGPIVVTPSGRKYQFAGELTVGRIFGEIGLPTFVVRPARLERAISWFVAGRRESTGGSGRPLPQCFRCSGDRPKPPETASSRRGLSAVCQSCDPLVLGIGWPVFGVERALFSRPIVSHLAVVLSSPEGSSMGVFGPEAGWIVIDFSQAERRWQRSIGPGIQRLGAFRAR